MRGHGGLGGLGACAAQARGEGRANGLRLEARGDFGESKSGEPTLC